jgi:membrane associated rhomboid family serine protease
MDDLTELRTAERRTRSDEWALVLEASGLHPVVSRAPTGWILFVPGEEAELARIALEAWERENPRADRPQTDPEGLDSFAIRHALTVGSVLVGSFFVTGTRRSGSVWFERGASDAVRVLGGEPWRVVTALTLHADLGHVVGNAVAGALFLAGVFRVFGFGVGAALVLVTGASGNALNAVFRGSEHISVGASTAVFGALGLLAGRGLARGRARGLRGRAAFLPVAAALALLAMIGTEGERVDFWAHGFGLLVGITLGAGMIGLGTTRLAAPAVQRSAGALTLAVLAGAWVLALL